VSLLSPGAASQFYEMAAKDKVCGINLVALNDLDLGAWIDRPEVVACMDLIQNWNDTASWTIDMPSWSEDLGAA
jgi:hypothetical protein